MTSALTSPTLDLLVKPRARYESEAVYQKRVADAAAGQEKVTVKEAGTLFKSGDKRPFSPLDDEIKRLNIGT